MDKRCLQTCFSFLFLLAITACSGGGASVPNSMTTRSSFGAVTSRIAAPRRQQSVAPGSNIAIDAGSTAAVGAFSADTGYAVSGQSGVTRVGYTIDTSQISNAAPMAVYQTVRYATQLKYTVTGLSANSAYNVRLHFVESYFNTVHARVFDGFVNGNQVFSSFDIFQSAGGSNRAIARVVPAISDATGAITIALVASVNNAALAAIEVSAATSSPTEVIAINSGSTSAQGKWLADADYQTVGWSGIAVVKNSIDTSKVSSPAPQSVYQSQRFAHSLIYTIPSLTPGAVYDVRLHFVESFFSSPGLRLFNITVNGTPVASNYDILKAAGGQNIALANDYAATANANGQVVVELAATVNNASIAGLEVFTGSPGASPSPSPIPSPSASPIGDGALPSTLYQEFSGSSPLLTPIVNLPHSTLSASVEQAAFNMEITGPAGGAFGPTQPFNYQAGAPYYVSSASDEVVTVSCNSIWSGCDADGVKVHVNPQDLVQNGSDQHLMLLDKAYNIEVDCWLALANNGTGGTGAGSGTGDLRPNLTGGILRCGYGGVYTLGTAGLLGNFAGGSYGSSGIAFGPAGGEGVLMPQEMLNGVIHHALWFIMGCANNPMMYPSNTYAQTDKSCDGSTNHPHYGDIFQLNWSTSRIASSSHSVECKAVLTALATYGGYVTDTGDIGTKIDTEQPYVYTSDPGEMEVNGVNPWTKIESDMTSAGDASNGNWNYCLQGLSASDFNLVSLTSP